MIYKSLKSVNDNLNDYKIKMTILNRKLHIIIIHTDECGKEKI